MRYPDLRVPCASFAGDTEHFPWPRVIAPWGFLGSGHGGRGEWGGCGPRAGLLISILRIQELGLYKVLQVMVCTAVLGTGSPVITCTAVFPTVVGCDSLLNPFLRSRFLCDVSALTLLTIV